MSAIFDAVIFRQQRGSAISLATPNQALLIPSPLLSYQTQRQFAWLGSVRTCRGMRGASLSLRPPQIERAMSPIGTLSDASRAVLHCADCCRSFDRMPNLH